MGVCIALTFVSYHVAEPQKAPVRAPPAVNPIQRMLDLPQPPQRRPGIAAALLLDTSGSMRQQPRGPQGAGEPKIATARRALVAAAGQFERYWRAHPEQELLLGIYEFSALPVAPSCRAVLPLGRPDAARAASAVNSLTPNGGTPIGDAMIAAKQQLDQTGLSRTHLLVITDGENNRGYAPQAVAEVMSRQPEDRRTAVYFIAFDIEAQRFASLRESGVLVMGAANAEELGRTVEYILTGKILVEQPEPPK
jgi:hypothetical protein